MNWKSKINLVILTTIMLCASVGLAYTVGQIVTPKQFDNQDFLIAPLNIEVTSKEKAGDIIFVYYAEVKSDIITFRNNTRQWLEDQKTKEYSEEINPEDLDIPTGELN
jgi:hypothetical protein